MAVLLGAQDVSRAADLQVAHGDLDTGAQLRKFTDGLQALLCLLLEHLVALIHEKRIGGAVGAAHAPADLVELREPQPVGVMDDDGVGVGNVKSRLDDGGGN